MKTLYLSDLDGTLLDRQDRISPFSLDVLNTLVERGLLFSIATARSWSSASRVVRGLDLRHPLVLYNGGCLFDAKAGRALESQRFDLAQKQELAQLFSSLRLSPLVYAVQQGRETVTWLRDLENEGVRRYLSLRPNDPRFLPLEAGQEERLYLGDVFYFSCIGEREELLPLYQAVQNDPRFNCLFHQELYRSEYWCEIMPRGATKAAAALRLKALLGCERMVCFGDAINDLPLFQACDEAYAVENAVEPLKAAATAVIPANTQDGVARFLLEREG